MFFISFSAFAECKKEPGDRFKLPGNFVQVAGDENPGKIYKLAQRPEDKKKYIFSVVEKQDKGRWHYYRLKIERVYNNGRTKTLAGFYRLSCSVVDPVAKETGETKEDQRQKVLVKAVKEVDNGLNKIRSTVTPQAKCATDVRVDSQKKKDIVSIKQFYSDDIVAFIKGFEGFEDMLYTCAGGKCTIGYGHMVHCEAKGCNYKAESFFRNKDGSPRQISQIEALELLKKDMNQKARAPILRYVKPEILEKLNQSQRDALVSFVFNVGSGNFRTSTLLKELNKGNLNKVPSEMKRWNKAKGKVLDGLVRRRSQEAQLFQSGG